MTKQTKDTKVSTATRVATTSTLDKLVGYGAIILLAASFLRAVQQEAQHSSVIVYVMGVAVVVFVLKAAYKVIK